MLSRAAINCGIAWQRGVTSATGGRMRRPRAFTGTSLNAGSCSVFHTPLPAPSHSRLSPVKFRIFLMRCTFMLRAQPCKCIVHVAHLICELNDHSCEHWGQHFVDRWEDRCRDQVWRMGKSSNGKMLLVKINVKKNQLNKQIKKKIEVDSKQHFETNTGSASWLLHSSEAL